ncbi:hypothetical protein ACFQS7_27945 [Dankookia sp. GCM10030260]|uniref:hypothetical protein n=1 Tax=Dankookia sp. GCM10030260 TaxID=3273390 RepID=UPI00361FC631
MEIVVGALSGTPTVARKWVGTQLGGRQRNQGARTTAEVHRLDRQQGLVGTGATRSTAPSSFTLIDM